MGLLKILVARALSLLGVLLAVLLLLVITIGATGYSDKILTAVVSEELRSLRSGLAETIRDPDELEMVLESRKTNLIQFYGLDDPWYNRMPDTIFRVITLDLGNARTVRSFNGSSRISDIVLERLPNTALLLTTSLLITGILGLFIGVKLATQVGSFTDRAISLFSAISFALPAWWAGILLILLLSFHWNLLPSGGMYSTPAPTEPILRFLDLLKHSILPIITIVLVSIGPYLYSVRAMTINVARDDHVNIARAKGLPESTVRRRHILRVAAPPIVTSLMLSLVGTLGGSILVETVFNWQGMGRLIFESFAGTPDESVIVALTFVYTLLYVVGRFVLEVLYLILDPRVRYT